jgi:hypothetical protein
MTAVQSAKCKVQSAKSLDAGGAVYALKGNSTLEFWRYEPSDRSDESDGSDMSYPWQQLADVPAGAKPVKEGSGLAAVQAGDTSFVYLLKGSGTTEFYRHNTVNNTWQAMADAPLGVSGKTFKNGSCITYDGVNTIYALKGSYNEFFLYDVAGDAWSVRTAMPFIGRSGKKKKAKDGGCLAAVQSAKCKMQNAKSPDDGSRTTDAGGGAEGVTPQSSIFNLQSSIRPSPLERHQQASIASPGAVYCLKGGNTQEFWVYRPSSGDWAQYEDMPIGGGKKVKGGGCLAAVQSAKCKVQSAKSPDDGGALYALKGNNTLEFWKYALGSGIGDRGSGFGVQSHSSLVTRHSPLVVAPNPFKTAVTLAIGLDANAAATVYDNDGRRVRRLSAVRANGRTLFTWDGRNDLDQGVVPGIYFYRVTSTGKAISGKLILTR